MSGQDDRLRHALSEELHEQIFREEVLPSYFRSSMPVANARVAIILGGQPGAGKTQLLNDATEELRARGWTVVINGDDLRSFHPGYGHLQQTDPLNAARYTDHDSGRWVEKLITAAQERGASLVIESTMRRPEVFIRTGGALRDAGYTVEARALAVSERLSWQGVHQRYEAALAAGSAARFSARDAHDAGASGMLETLRRVEQEKFADRVMITTRTGLILYDNRLESGDWREPARAAAVVHTERTRTRSPEELNEIAQTWTAVLDSMRRRGASEGEMKRVERQATEDGLAFRASGAPNERTGGGGLGARAFEALARYRQSQQPPEPSRDPTPIAHRTAGAKPADAGAAPADPASEPQSDPIRPARPGTEPGF